MKYQNKVTGVIIDVKSKISGGNWQPLQVAKAPEVEVAPVQAKKRKVTGKNE